MSFYESANKILNILSFSVCDSKVYQGYIIRHHSFMMKPWVCNSKVY